MCHMPAAGRGEKGASQSEPQFSSACLLQNLYSLQCVQYAEYLQHLQVWYARFGPVELASLGAAGNLQLSNEKRGGKGN